jgi:hypothetical protein
MGRASGASGAAEVDFYIRPIGQMFNSKIHEYITQAQGFESNGGVWVQKVQEFADFKWHIHEVSDNNTQFSGQIVGYVQDNK